MAECEGDDRTAGERLDQEWTELLEELRVVLPGTEVLFAFLLSLPFTQRFGEVAGSDKTVYTVAFLAAAAALLLMAPSAQHRLLWRTHRKAPELKLATGFAIAGTFCLAVAVACVVYVVMHALYETRLPALTTAGAVALILVGWYAVPLALRLRRNHGTAARSPASRSR